MPAGCLQELGAHWDAPAALACVVPPLAAALQAFETQGFAPLAQRFAARDALAARPVRLSDGSEGVADGVAPDGALRLRTADGAVALVSSAEVSVRPLSTQES